MLAALTQRLPAARLPRSARTQRRSLSRAHAAGGKEAPATLVTDASVPEGHRDLHAMLYDAGEHEAHAETAETAADLDTAGGTVDAALWLAGAEGSSRAGVFAVHSSSGACEFVGYSRSLAPSIEALLATLGADRVAAVRVRAWPRDRLPRRDDLQAVVDEWVGASSPSPPGNDTESTDHALWMSHSDPSKLSGAARDSYVEGRVKMRKAMGENLNDTPDNEAPDERAKRLSLISAVEGDDWSSVIDGQTKATQQAVVSAESAPAAAMQSPFEAPLSPPPSPLPSSEAPTLSIASVDACLEAVRPYLEADGGGVDVVGVESGVVALRLQGACVACPASAATMSMGVERALKQEFGEQLVKVVEIGGGVGGPGGPGGGALEVTVDAIERHLDELRPTATKYGARVAVQRLELSAIDDSAALAVLCWSGPRPLAMGVEASIKDKWAGVEVELVDFDDEDDDDDDSDTYGR